MGRFFESEIRTASFAYKSKAVSEGFAKRERRGTRLRVVNRFVEDIPNARCLSYGRTCSREMKIEMVLLTGSTGVGDGLAQHSNDRYVSRYRLSGTVVEKGVKRTGA